MKRGDVLFLFDVDGTLTPSRGRAPDEILRMLADLKNRVMIAFVGGSDIEKQIEQIGADLLTIFDYGFPENGLQYYREGRLVESQSILQFLGEDRYKMVVNKLLYELSQVECPVKRGLFIELRDSMINVSPIGRSCSQAERERFYEYDKKNGVRERYCEKVRDEVERNGLQISIGGQISIDIFPRGWDKTYCLNHVKERTIIFFGDMVGEGGNDREIYENPRVRGVRVDGPADTVRKVEQMINEITKIPSSNSPNEV